MAFSYDKVELTFAEGALEAVADKAIERNIGARGLRAVMEGLLTEIMYEIPSDPSVRRVVITPACVHGECGPSASKPRARLSVRRSMIFSRPSKAPPQIKRMFLVITPACVHGECGPTLVRGEEEAASHAS